MGHAMADSTVAVRQFQEIFLDDARRQDRAQWRDYFISEIFLDAQYEEDFMSAVHGFLQRQNIVPYTKLPDGLVVELAIVYVLRPGEQDHLAPVEACEEAADIWNCQENREKHYQELMSKASFIRRKSYAEYRTMRRVVVEDTWEYRHSDDDMEEYKFTLSMASRHFIADDDRVNSMDIDDIRLEDNITHVCEVELYDYLLRKYGFPVGACSYMYKYFELDNIEATEYAQIYRNLKAHILEQYPDINDFVKSNITAEDYADDLITSLEELRDRYNSLGWGKNFVDVFHPCYATEVTAWCEEEADQVYRIVASPLFQKYQCDEYIVNKLITFGYTVTQAKILYEIYDKPELYLKSSRIMRLVHRLFVRITAYGRQEQYVASQSYDYDLEIGSYDFWEYFLTVAAGDRSIRMDQEHTPIPWGFLYEDKMMLPAYMNWTYMPSVEWRLRFTGYDKGKGRFGAERKLTLKIREALTVIIAFHYHFVRYFVNDEQVFLPVFDVDSLFTYAADDNTLFLLLLPITCIKDEERQRVQERLMGFLPQLVRLPASARYLAAMLSNDNASVHRIMRVSSRRYIENLADCYRLDQYHGGGQRLYRFHAKYGCWEYVGMEMCGKHYRERLEKMLGEANDEEGWDMTSFKESDLSLPYEVETGVHDLAGSKTKEKINRLIELFQARKQCDGKCMDLLVRNKVILVFGDRERMQLRQHFAADVLPDHEAEEKAYREHRYLRMQMERLEKYAKKDQEWQWKGWMELENYHNAIPL